MYVENSKWEKKTWGEKKESTVPKIGASGECPYNNKSIIFKPYSALHIGVRLKQVCSGSEGSGYIEFGLPNS